MQAEQPLRFEFFRVDPVNVCLWRKKQALALTLRAFAVLRYLVEHAGQLVTKDELFRAVWSDTVVSDAALTSCIQELRQVLGDEAKRPQYIETIHRRGYRFIAKVRRSKFKIRGSKSKPTPYTLHPAPSLVGRDAELAQLHKWLEKALRGERWLIFVTGEAGIGKTTVVEAFVASLRANNNLWLGRGQCIEHYGPGEAYLPVLEALGRLCREPGGARLIELLAQQAPTWLVQMPTLLSATDLEALQRTTQGTMRERMLRELTEAIEVLTTERPLVLWLEDLQWSDVSTLDWLAFVARRQEQARLLVIGTYRPVDMLVREHPLKAVKQELQLHGHCQELALNFLSAAAVQEYLSVRFPVRATSWSPLQLARLIYQRTDGNPLFMVNMVDHLVRQGVIGEVNDGWALKAGLKDVEAGVPESLRQLIERQLGQVSPAERAVLEAASVAGAEFSAAAVAAGVVAEVDEVEEHCEKLSQRGQFLRSHGTSEWPDGTAAARYGFIHALYQEVLYKRVMTRRRQRFHQRIGERVEQAYGQQAREVATELAMHFERGRDYHRAVQYLQQAGENALRRSAYVEAVSLLTKGLELLKALPDTPERTQQELTLQIALGPTLGMTKGFAALEMEQILARAWELCQPLGESPQLFLVLQQLQGFYLIRGELRRAHELGERFQHLATSVQDPAPLMAAYATRGITHCCLGEFSAARAHFEQGVTRYGPQKYRSHALVSRVAPGSNLSWAAWTLWFLGYPNQALQRSHAALTLTQESSHPFGLVAALNFAAALHQLRREVQAVQERAEAALALSTEHGFALLSGLGTILRGWALAAQGQGEEGITQMCQGLAAYRATGTELNRPYFLALLAEAYGKVGQAEEGLSVLTEALTAVNKTGERYYEAELYRLAGELSLRIGESETGRTGDKKILPGSPILRFPVSSPEESFQKAIEIARRQSAKSWELRAVMSLSRLWQQQGKRAEARQMLAEIYGWFTEGFDTADLQEAKALLEELNH